MRVCTVSIDVEDDLDKVGSFKGVENLDALLEVLQRHEIEATLFVTGEILKKYTDLVVRWSRRHEIACHGYYHVSLHDLALVDRDKQLAEFCDLYVEVFGKRPEGFRAVQHSIDDEQMKLLEKHNFAYDSSVIPRYVPLWKYVGYKGKAPLEPYHPCHDTYREKGDMSIMEIPVVPPILGVPLTGTYVRVFGPCFFRALLLFKKPAYLGFTIHSWDCVAYTGRYSKNSGPRFMEMLEKILGRLSKNYTFMSGSQLCNRITGLEHDGKLR